MGDRVSIQFQLGKDKSVVFFSHWDGMGLVEIAKAYVNGLKEVAKKEGSTYPLFRLEPDTVIVDFIKFYTTEAGPVKSNYYLGATPEDGDNSDNGHWIISLD